MTKLTIVEPVVGELNSAADPKIPTGFKEVEKVINGELEGTNNFKAEGIVAGNIKAEAIGTLALANEAVTEAKIPKAKAFVATDQAYGARTARTFATEYEPSAIRRTEVALSTAGGSTTIFEVLVAGVHIQTCFGANGCTFTTNPKEKWTTVLLAGSTELFSNYRIV
jgi:hypothetical protein